MPSRTSPSISFLAGGDVAINRSRARGAFGRLTPLFQEADVAFVNLELPLSRGGAPARGKNLVRGTPEMAEALIEARFDVLAFANNHALDYGEEAFLDTLALMEARSVPVVGAGTHLDAARRPVVLERKGLRIGMLAYCSVLPRAFAAGPRVPPPDANPLRPYEPAGVNPLRAYTAYRPLEGIDEQPGKAPEILTWADPKDLRQMREDIRALRPRVDTLIVNHHWGTSMVPDLRAFQREIGHAAVDAGADVVLGGHPHVLQGVEFYRGKPIVYSMGNLLFDFFVPFFTVASSQTFLFGCTLAKRAVRDTYILPCRCVQDKPPTLLSSSRGPGREIFRVVQSRSKDLGTRLEIAKEQVLLFPEEKESPGR